jgi:hypothetical protein
MHLAANYKRNSGEMKGQRIGASISPESIHLNSLGNPHERQKQPGSGQSPLARRRSLRGACPIDTRSVRRVVQLPRRGRACLSSFRRNGSVSRIRGNARAALARSDQSDTRALLCSALPRLLRSEVVVAVVATFRKHSELCAHRFCIARLCDAVQLGRLLLHLFRKILHLGFVLE